MLVLLSCTKSETNISPSSVESKKIAVFKTTTDFSTQVQLFNLLSGKEKFQFWKENLANVQKLTSVKNNALKIALIQELSASISSEVFEEGSNQNIIFKNYTSAIWVKKAAQAFSKEELYDYFFDHQQIQTNLVGEPNVLADCFCHVGNSGYSCKQTSVGFPSGVTIKHGMCEQPTDCKESSSGCGLLWFESCNGGHCNYG